ncbi:MAG TPA: ABC transporter substrate-binding protein [Deltaproteobacteria bacterium]|nr:ABC transporter substrate-binding protein [Deltaproteobacteria bacterium]HOM28516.1 ABC transporter substrate-binding protein [Deltaproteobacteria bacterium]HPP81002.1 ABC transporter substrate-binding protein [Deltaproteobacteria bacterium]
MKKAWVFLVVTVIVASWLPAFSKDTYYIEVLQVSKINPFDMAYQGFIDELAKNAIVKGKNLTIHRHVIDADADASIWKKVSILMQIKSKASEIVDKKPDLVLTIGTPATKYSKDKFIAAGIPVVFTAVAVPQAVGCKSLTEPGPGFTGSTLYMDPTKAFKITKLAFPNLTKMGIVHSDDDNAIAFTEEAKKKASALGITVLNKEVGKSDSPKAAAEELLGKGVQAFGIPIDAYYALRNYGPLKELLSITDSRKIPVISFCYVGFEGGLLYIGSEFNYIGSLAGRQASQILKQGVKPETLPVVMQEDLTILVDLDTMKKLGITLPMEILRIAKSVESAKK